VTELYFEGIERKILLYIRAFLHFPLALDAFQISHIYEETFHNTVFVYHFLDQEGNIDVYSNTAKIRMSNFVLYVKCLTFILHLHKLKSIYTGYTHIRVC
jgi:hypothetical protein